MPPSGQVSSLSRTSKPTVALARPALLCPAPPHPRLFKDLLQPGRLRADLSQAGQRRRDGGRGGSSGGLRAPRGLGERSPSLAWPRGRQRGPCQPVLLLPSRPRPHAGPHPRSISPRLGDLQRLLPHRPAGKRPRCRARARTAGNWSLPECPGRCPRALGQPSPLRGCPGRGTLSQRD